MTPKIILIRTSLYKIQVLSCCDVYANILSSSKFKTCVYTTTVTFNQSVLEDQCGHHVTLEVKCNEDGFLDEEIVFENKSEQTFTLKIRSKLMGNHMGTPALKSGVKLLHKAFDVSSDAASDWQGFE